MRQTNPPLSNLHTCCITSTTAASFNGSAMSASSPPADWHAARASSQVLWCPRFQCESLQSLKQWDHKTIFSPRRLDQHVGISITVVGEGGLVIRNHNTAALKMSTICLRPARMVSTTENEGLMADHGSSHEGCIVVVPILRGGLTQKKREKETASGWLSSADSFSSFSHSHSHFVTSRKGNETDVARLWQLSLTLSCPPVLGYNHVRFFTGFDSLGPTMQQATSPYENRNLSTRSQRAVVATLEVSYREGSGNTRQRQYFTIVNLARITAVLPDTWVVVPHIVFDINQFAIV